VPSVFINCAFFEPARRRLQKLGKARTRAAIQGSSLESDATEKEGAYTHTNEANGERGSHHDTRFFIYLENLKG
jgi:hypothetical protein